MTVDFVIEKDNDGIYDLVIENGEFKKTSGLCTSLVMSLFIDARADESEVSEASLRRGWIGNEQNENPDFQLGSKLWLLDQTRVSDVTLNNAISYAKEAYDWMIESNIVKDIMVTGTKLNDNISLTIQFIRFDGSIFKKQFLLWENTKGF